MGNRRFEQVLNRMKEEHLCQMIISDPASIFYLTEKWIHPGERMLVLYVDGEGNHKLFVNELFPVDEDLGIEKVWFKDTDEPVEILSRAIRKEKTLGIDKNWPARFLLKLMELSPGCSMVNASYIVDGLRMIKDEEEALRMQEASRVNDEAMERVIQKITGAHSEKKMGQLLMDLYEQLGAEGFSFDPIIAYGANCADPHHSPDHSMVKEGDSVIIDIGCRKSGYCSDMTRTLFYKSVSDKAKEVYNIVKEANLRAIAAVKPGVRFCDIDGAARSYIEEKGYGKYFTHRTGHSIGIDVHDFGDVSAVNMDCVQRGMIFSIEPGIYIPGEFGVRIEDLVLVTEEGCQVLNAFSKELQIIE